LGYGSNICHYINFILFHYTCYKLHFFPFFAIESIPYGFFLVIGLILLAIGIPSLIISAKTIIKGFKEGKLVTQGVYSICRHPLYATFILFIVPVYRYVFKNVAIIHCPGYYVYRI